MPLEYMRQSPPDEDEGFECHVCHDDYSVNAEHVHIRNHKKEEIYFCFGCAALIHEQVTKGRSNPYSHFYSGYATIAALREDIAALNAYIKRSRPTPVVADECKECGLPKFFVCINDACAEQYR